MKNRAEALLIMGMALMAGLDGGDTARYLPKELRRTNTKWEYWPNLGGYLPKGSRRVGAVRFTSMAAIREHESQ